MDVRIVEYAKTLGIIGLSEEGAAVAVARRLKVMHPEADPLVCEKCRFPSPDTVAIPVCPSCGAVFAGKKKEKQKMVQTAHVALVKDEKSKPEQKVEKTESKQGEVLVELKKLEEKIDKARSSQVLVDWDIGAQLAEISKRDLWRASPSASKSFVAYAKERFGIGKDTTRAYLMIVETFTREQAADFNITQLWLLARVPDGEQRSALIEKIKTGKISTGRELAAEVKVKRAEAGLKTERAGFEGQVFINARMKPGRVAEGDFKQVRAGGYVFSFELGGARFHVWRPAVGPGVEIKLIGAVEPGSAAVQPAEPVLQPAVKQTPKPSPKLPATKSGAKKTSKSGSSKK